MNLSNLLPSDARDYKGPQFARWAAMVFLVIVTVRSLIHVLAPDGGAESIATIDTTVEGGSNIIALQDPSMMPVAKRAEPHTHACTQAR